jgi:hypothetical protein
MVQPPEGVKREKLTLAADEVDLHRRCHAFESCRADTERPGRKSEGVAVANRFFVRRVSQDLSDSSRRVHAASQVAWACAPHPAGLLFRT